MSQRDERLTAAIHTAAAEFINRESNRRSLITVTKVILTDEKRAQIFISVFPEKDGHAAVDFLARQHKEFLVFVKKTVKLHIIPQMSFVLDPAMGTSPETTVDENA